ncbi:MAG TPA: hypothetical protein PLN12_16535 [Flavobacteriales bacterium]|nr:hypothetical protein [Flavobacteriales bacterium]
MSTILLPAQLDGYSNRKDKTVALRFITQEQTSEQVAHIHSQIDGFGYLFFKVESEITAAERAELDALQTDLYDNPKTQSQRLRNVLFRLHEQDDEGVKGFAEFYKKKTDQIIQHFKDKLEPR